MDCPYNTGRNECELCPKECSGTESEMQKCEYVGDEEFYNELLWNLLKDHWGHKVEIAMYGPDAKYPDSVTLEDLDTGEVILDAGIYTICAREDI